MTGISLSFSESIVNLFPGLRLGILRSEVVIRDSSDDLIRETGSVINDLSGRINSDYIRNMPVVKESKDAYRRLGKDPNRYRPSGESLLRRVSSGKGLYQVNNVVDCLNLTSVQTGFSICGFDRVKISGTICLGIGRENEPYQGIGRGDLNISRLPVFRDEKGAFGTPTSDSMRTMIDEDTSEVLIIFPDFFGSGQLEEAMMIMSGLLQKYVEKAMPEWQVLDVNNRLK